MRKPSPAMFVALAALFVALGGVGVAATGGNFILGMSNTAGAKTSLSAAINGRALDITNMNTGGSATALGLNVASGHPPLTVNSTTKVANLNADQLDGMDSSRFYRSGTDTVEWFPPFSYRDHGPQDDLRFADVAGPALAVQKPIQGDEYVLLPLDGPETIDGKPVKLKSVTVCFESFGAYIGSTTIYGIPGDSGGTLLYNDYYTHAPATSDLTCYDVAPVSPTVIGGAAYLMLDLFFNGSNSINLFAVKEITTT